MARAPRELDPLAVEILEALRSCPQAARVVLGGYIALSQHVDYRASRDIDGWWARDTTAKERESALTALREVVENVGCQHGLECGERKWGDVVSLELKRTGQTVLSVQIAERDVELEPPTKSPWPPLRLETLRDTLGAKMNALVRRGAPRDFADIHAVVTRELATLDECWQLWQRKNPTLDMDQAKAQVAKHLESIALHQPVETLAEQHRQMVAAVRKWWRDNLVR